MVVAVIISAILLITPIISTGLVYAASPPSGPSPSTSAAAVVKPTRGNDNGNNNDNNRLGACANQPSQKQGTMPPFCDGQLTVIKQVQGGTAIPSQFVMHVTGNNPSQSSFPGSSSGTSITLGQGSYQVIEDTIPNYDPRYSSDCSGSIIAGQTKTCIITNTFSVAQLIVIKHVINDNGGTKTAKDFTISVSGNNVSPQSSFPGAESPGTTVTLSPGSYNVAESAPSGYSAFYSSDCFGTINSGQTKTCIITNNDNNPEQPVSINVNHVLCTDITATQRGVSVEFVVAGVSHDSQTLTYPVDLLSSSGSVIHHADITIPPEAPNPASTLIVYTLPLTPGTYTLRATVNGQEVNATFVAPDCTSPS